MTTYDVVLLPGDGVGAEVAAQARRVLHAITKRTELNLSIDEIPCGGQYHLEHGRDWPEGAEARCEQADVLLLGAVGWPSPSGTGPVVRSDGEMAGWSAVIGNRQRLDLFANLRPVRLFEGVQPKIGGRHRDLWRPEDVDMVFVRENTEGLYAGMRGTLARGGQAQLATDTRIVTRQASERVIRRAFEIASVRTGAPRDGQPRVTCICKDNVLDGCRLFRRVFEEVSETFVDIEGEVALVDAFAQWLITEPDRYDVLVTTNLFGDIVTDLAAVLQGGLGLAVGGNVGDRHAMFEPIHGSAPPFAGRDELNPMAMILAVAEALRWLGATRDDAVATAAGDRIEQAVRAVLRTGPWTRDLVEAERAGSMSEVTSAIIERF